VLQAQLTLLRHRAHAVGGGCPGEQRTDLGDLVGRQPGGVADRRGELSAQGTAGDVSVALTPATAVASATCWSSL